VVVASPKAALLRTMRRSCNARPARLPGGIRERNELIGALGVSEQAKLLHQAAKDSVASLCGDVAEALV
jgi:hypothetical protein